MSDTKISSISRLANILTNTLKVYGACVHKKSVESDIKKRCGENHDDNYGNGGNDNHSHHLVANQFFAFSLRGLCV